MGYGYWEKRDGVAGVPGKGRGASRGGGGGGEVMTYGPFLTSEKLKVRLVIWPFLWRAQGRDCGETG